jgi:hypothetical protein
MSDNGKNGKGQVVSHAELREKLKEVIDLVDVGQMRVKGDVLNHELVIENKSGGASIKISANGPCLVVTTDYGELRVRKGKFRMHVTHEDEQETKPTPA